MSSSAPTFWDTSGHSEIRYMAVSGSSETSGETTWSHVDKSVLFFQNFLCDSEQEDSTLVEAPAPRSKRFFPTDVDSCIFADRGTHGECQCSHGDTAADAKMALPKKCDTLLDLCVSSFRRGHANLLCIIPILTDDLRRGSNRQCSLKTYE